MKTTIGMILAMLAILMVGRYAPPAAPNSIRVFAPTEQSIKQEMKREQLRKQYRQAEKAAAQVYRRNGCRGTFAGITGQVAIDYGISPRVLAALVFVESSCRPNAGFKQASVGLTQVNTAVWKLSKAQLRDPEKNLRIGASILASYVHRFGLVEGLHHYNGLGNPSNSYAEKVLSAAGLS